MKTFFRIAILSCAALSLGVGCVQPRYAYHTSYELKGCSRAPTRDEVTRALVGRGYSHSAEPKGPFDIFHKPDIVKKGLLAQEPYEDKAGDFAVAWCAGHGENWLVSEEWTSCKDHKDCTAPDQRELRALAEKWGCQVSERSGHSESWKLEERQDWTKDTCANIASQLSF